MQLAAISMERIETKIIQRNLRLIQIIHANNILSTRMCQKGPAEGRMRSKIDAFL